MSARAWLLNFGRGLKAAVGLHEMSQIMLSSAVHKIPTTPFYVSEILLLEEQVLPVIDVPKLLSGNETLLNSNNIIGIAMYQSRLDNRVHSAGMRLAVLPITLEVEDDQACELPDSLSFWQPLCISCFSHENEAIPIIDLARLFSAEIKTLVPQPEIVQ